MIPNDRYFRRTSKDAKLRCAFECRAKNNNTLYKVLSPHRPPEPPSQIDCVAFLSQAYKYIPYGRVGETIPYLLRRAQENAGMLSGATHERALLVKEIRRRFFGQE